MFSKALTNMIHLKDFNALDILSSTAERLSQGEIQQIEKAIKKRSKKKKTAASSSDSDDSSSYLNSEWESINILAH